MQVFQTGRSHMVVLTRPPPNAPLPALGSTMNSPREHSSPLADSTRNQNGTHEDMPGTVVVEVQDAKQQTPTEVRFHVASFRQLYSASCSKERHSSPLAESTQNQNGTHEDMPGTVVVEVQDAKQQTPTEVRGCLAVVSMVDRDSQTCR